MKRNPFIQRGIVKSEKSFWNRVDEFRDIYSWLLDVEEEPQSIVVMGQRRIGKSSLLYQVHRRAKADPLYEEQLARMTSVMISLQGLTVCTREQFFNRILQNVDRDCDWVGRLYNCLPAADAATAETRFETFIHDIDRAGYSFVLILDEFEAAAINATFDQVFFNKLRSLAQEWRLAYVIATHHALDEIWNPQLISSPYSSPFFNYFQTLNLRGFAAQDAEQYLRQVSAQAGLAFGEPEVALAREVGGTHPFFLTIAADHIFQTLAGVDPARSVDTPRLREQIYQDPVLRGNFNYYWTNLSEADQDLLAQAARGELGPPATATIQVGIQKLERLSLLERSADGTYKPFSQAFEAFILSCAPGSPVPFAPQAPGIQRDVTTLVAQSESNTLEFKSSLRWDIRLNKVADYIEHEILKTLAAFLNTSGGTLMVGISDEGEVLGLAADYKTFKKKDRDGFQQHLMQLVSTQLGKVVCQYVQLVFHVLEPFEVCEVIVTMSREPIFTKEGKFYIRTGNLTQELNAAETMQYLRRRS